MKSEYVNLGRITLKTCEGSCDQFRWWEFRRSSKEVGIDVFCYLQTKIITTGIRNKLQEKYLPKDEYTLYKFTMEHVSGGEGGCDSLEKKGHVSSVHW